MFNYGMLIIYICGTFLLHEVSIYLDIIGNDYERREKK